MKALAIASLVVIGVWGCKKDKAEPGGTGADKPAFTTKSRGEIKNITTGPKGSMFSIHHEAFPDWINSEGEPSPMMSMSMDFVAGPGLDVSGFKTGDKIAFEVAVYYKPKIKLLLTSATKLAADTALDFGM